MRVGITHPSTSPIVSLFITRLLSHFLISIYFFEIILSNYSSVHQFPFLLIPSLLSYQALRSCLKCHSHSLSITLAVRPNMPPKGQYFLSQILKHALLKKSMRTYYLFPFRSLNLFFSTSLHFDISSFRFLK